MIYERLLKSTLLSELSSPTTVIQVLIGPRQVGKTTIARQIQESIRHPYRSTPPPTAQFPWTAAWIETQWRRAMAEGSASGGPVLLILDEVQKVRGWSETLKLLLG